MERTYCDIVGSLLLLRGINTQSSTRAVYNAVAAVKSGDMIIRRLCNEKS